MSSVQEARDALSEAIEEQLELTKKIRTLRDEYCRIHPERITPIAFAELQKSAVNMCDSLCRSIRLQTESNQKLLRNMKDWQGGELGTS